MPKLATLLPVTTVDSFAGPPVTVVIATRDRPEMLRDALGALRSALRKEDRVIVVDSASRDERTHIVAESFGAQVVRCDTPGTCRARNAGLRAAATDVVAFTDDDCLPDADWTSALGAAFARSPLPDFVAGRVLAEGERSGRAQAVLSTTEETERLQFLVGTDPSKIGHGANMAWRRVALEAIGGFDESMGPGTPFRAAEDHDVFWRALRAGCSGSFEPEAIVRHKQWRPRREQLRTCYGYGVGSGAFAMKRWRMDRPGAQETAALGWSDTLRRGMREIVWQHGVVAPIRSIRQGYEMGVLIELAMLAGGITGLIRARAAPLADGRFTSARDIADRGLSHEERTPEHEAGA
jgi:GT2 family glycosyltransferase